MKNQKAKVLTTASGLVWNWADEDTDTVDLNQFNDGILQQATLHGLKQKLADSYSGAITVREAKEAFSATLKNLEAGMWNAGRSTTGGIWVEALARAAAVDLEEALEKWAGLDEDQQKDLKKNPQVKQAKAEIELERAKAKAKGTELDLSSI